MCVCGWVGVGVGVDVYLNRKLLQDVFILVIALLFLSLVEGGSASSFSGK